MSIVYIFLIHAVIHACKANIDSLLIRPNAITKLINNIA